jgi:serine protease Do
MNGYGRPACVAIALAASVAALTAAAVPAAAQSQAEELSASFRKALDRVRPALVAVRPPGGPARLLRPGAPPLAGPLLRQDFDARGFPRVGDPLPEPAGSGFVIDAERGSVLTTDSNLQGASQAAVIFADGRERNTVEIRRDPQTDLALLFIDPKGLNLTPARWGDAGSLQVGDWVLSVGQPPSSAPSVSAGIVSARRTVMATGLAEEFIETDAVVNRLISGGPLINLRGEVLGLTTLHGRRSPAEGMSLALPGDLVRRIAADLAESGRVRRGFIGVDIVPQDRATGAAPGPRGAVVVSSVAAGSPAADAGLRPGDVIRSAGGRAVTGVAMLRATVSHAPIGQELTLSVERAGSQLEIKVRPREQPNPPGFSGPGVPPRVLGEARRDNLRSRMRSRDNTAIPAPPRAPRPVEEEQPDSLEPLPGQPDARPPDAPKPAAGGTDANPR